MNDIAEQVIFPPPPEDDEDTPDLGPYSDTDDYKNRGNRIVAIAAGTHNNLAVAKDGSLYAWGQGSRWTMPAESHFACAILTQMYIRSSQARISSDWGQLTQKLRRQPWLETLSVRPSG